MNDKIKKLTKPFPLFLAFCIVSISVYYFIELKKFDKSRWSFAEDIHQYPDRNSILKDLTQNYLVIGMTYKQIKDFLGEPDNIGINEAKNDISYYIINDYGYGFDIDPVHTKSLILTLNEDKTLKSFRLLELKK